MLAVCTGGILVAIGYPLRARREKRLAAERMERAATFTNRDLQ